MRETMKIERIPLISLISIILYSSFGIGLVFIYGFSYHTISDTIRATAKVSLVLFAIIFIASPLHTLRPSNFTRWLLSQRKNIAIVFGITFLMSHIILICLLFYMNSAKIWDRIQWTDIYGGGLGLVLLSLMLITSFNKFSVSVKPEVWKRLHIIGLYCLWIIFTFDQVENYFLKSPPGSPEYYIPFLILLLFAMAVRVASMFSQNK